MDPLLFPVDDGPTPEPERATARLPRVAVLELLGFTVVLRCMIDVRRGL